jgi:hypothetical protein
VRTTILYGLGTMYFAIAALGSHTRRDRVTCVVMALLCAWAAFDAARARA